MDEVECPPTPLIAAGTQSPKTPPGSPSRSASPKAPAEDASSEQPSEKTEKNPNRESPEPNCAICLGKLQNKSFTDSCFHQFCFTCLLEWSKIKAECPLCKQNFKSIIHNVRSIEDYDQYHLHQPEPRISLAIDRRFRYRSTLTPERRHAIALEDLFLTHSIASDPIIPPQRISSRSLWRRRRQVATSEFRRRVYLEELWVQPTSDVTGRYRETSPEFYRSNPATTHRLVPWLNRELNILLYNHSTHGAYVLDLILGLIARYEINSRDFRHQLIPYFGIHTSHFIHEFYHFARSPYDMIGYDQYAQYGPNLSTEVQGLSSESADDDEGVPVIVLSSDSTSPPREEASSSRSSRRKGIPSRLTCQSSAQTEPARNTPSLDFSQPSTSRVQEIGRPDSPAPGPSGLNILASGLNPLAHFLSPSESDESEGSASSDPTGKRKTHGYIMPKKEIVEKEKSDSDECEIVGYVKPRHERTPEIITLSSEYETDVVDTVEREEEVPFEYGPWSVTESDDPASNSSGSEWTPSEKKQNGKCRKKPKRLPSLSDSDNDAGNGTSRTRNARSRTTSSWEPEDYTYWKKALRVKYNSQRRRRQPQRSSSSSSEHSIETERRDQRRKRRSRKQEERQARQSTRNTEMPCDHNYVREGSHSSYNPPYSASEIISFMDGDRPKLRIRSIVLPKTRSNHDEPLPSDSPSSSHSSHRQRERSSSQGKKHKRSSSRHKHKHKKKKHKRRRSTDSHTKHRKRRKVRKGRIEDSSS